ncbi:hypothetical protein ACVIHI_004061 [Bradyrhizobium sp. USDA 4524]
MMIRATRLLSDDQIATDAEHRRLQGHAQHLGGGAEAAGDVGGAPLAGHVTVVGRRPTRGEAPTHAHGVQHLGIAAAGLGQGIALCYPPGDVPGVRTRQPIGD